MCVSNITIWTTIRVGKKKGNDKMQNDELLRQIILLCVLLVFHSSRVKYCFRFARTNDELCYFRFQLFLFIWRSVTFITGNRSFTVSSERKRKRNVRQTQARHRINWRKSAGAELFVIENIQETDDDDGRNRKMNWNLSRRK